MSQTQDTLNVILGNIQNNKLQLAKQIIDCGAAMGNPTPDVQAAIDLLVKTYQGNVQTIGQTIGAQLQIEQMQKTSAEIDVLIAALQVVIADEANIEATGALVVAGAPSPLSLAAGDSQLAAADASSHVEAPAAAPEAAVAANAVGTSVADSGSDVAKAS